MRRLRRQPQPGEELLPRQAGIEKIRQKKGARMQPFCQALRILVRDMTGGMGLPKLAGQVVELSGMRGVDRASERVDKHFRPLHRAGVVRQSASGSGNEFPD